MRTFKEVYQFYRKKMGQALPVLFFLSVTAVLFESVGLTLFFPLISSLTGDGDSGNIFIRIFKAVHIQPNIEEILLLIFSAYFIRSIFLILQNHFVGRLVGRMFVELESNLLDRLFLSKFSFYMRSNAGFINNAIAIEARQASFAGRFFVDFLVGILFTIIYLLIPFLAAPGLMSIIVAIGLPSMLALKYLFRKTKDYSIELSEVYHVLQKNLIQALSHFKYLKATDSGHALVGLVKKQGEKIGKYFYFHTLFTAIAQYSMEPLFVAVVLGVIYFYFRTDPSQLPNHLLVAGLLFQGSKKVISVQANYQKLLKTYGSIRVVGQLEKELEACEESTGTFEWDSEKQEEIKFEAVSFSYGDHKVLDELSFSIDPGKVTAFVGRSGSGKTTILNLMMGLMDPSDGTIQINGQDLQKLSKKSLRKNLGYITQEPIVFEGTIADNITMWNSRANDESNIKQALDAACLDVFDSKNLSEKRNLSEFGKDLSGGQKQRLSIAREIFRDTPILILDEATSSLDSHTEQSIMNSIYSLKGNKTILIVAHRLSTVKNADKIYLLGRGKIIDSGTYDELLANSKEFQEMVYRQDLGSSKEL